MTYHDLIARNRRNSALLVIAFVLFIGVLVGVLGAGLLGVGLEESAALAAIATFGAGSYSSRPERASVVWRWPTC